MPNIHCPSKAFRIGHYKGRPHFRFCFYQHDYAMSQKRKSFRCNKPTRSIRSLVLGSETKCLIKCSRLTANELAAGIVLKQ